MKRGPKISEAESVVMEVLWCTHPMTTEEVVAALKARQSWQAPTIKTLLNRLLRKGAISAGKVGRRYSYSPVLDREEWISTESEGLLERLFGGRVAPLVAHFGERRKLTKRDIAELKRLIEDLDKKR
jgi:predicted transcriptional regulator